MSLLEELGYTHLAEFAGGMREWLEAGLPVDQDDGQPTPQTLLAQLVGTSAPHPPDAAHPTGSGSVAIPVQVTPPPVRSAPASRALPSKALCRRALDVL